MSAEELDLDAVEARTSLATGGPWFATYEDAVNSGAHRAVLFDGYEPEDADFIVHAREDVPALIAEVRRLREECDARRTSMAGLRASLEFKNGHIADLAATVERLEAETS